MIWGFRCAPLRLGLLLVAVLASSSGCGESSYEARLKEAEVPEVPDAEPAPPSAPEQQPAQPSGAPTPATSSSLPPTVTPLQQDDDFAALPSFEDSALAGETETSATATTSPEETAKQLAKNYGLEPASELSYWAFAHLIGTEVPRRGGGPFKWPQLTAFPLKKEPSDNWQSAQDESPNVLRTAIKDFSFVLPLKFESVKDVDGLGRRWIFESDDAVMVMVRHGTGRRRGSEALTEQFFPPRSRKDDHKVGDLDIRRVRVRMRLGKDDKAKFANFAFYILQYDIHEMWIAVASEDGFAHQDFKQLESAIMSLKKQD